MALSPELVGFVKEGLDRGLPREQIADILGRAGWPADQVRRPLAGVADVESSLPFSRPAVSTRPGRGVLYRSSGAVITHVSRVTWNLLVQLLREVHRQPAWPPMGSDALRTIVSLHPFSALRKRASAGCLARRWGILRRQRQGLVAESSSSSGVVVSGSAWPIVSFSADSVVVSSACGSLHLSRRCCARRPSFHSRGPS